jgi:hypothetical protein
MVVCIALLGKINANGCGCAIPPSFRHTGPVSQYGVNSSRYPVTEIQSSIVGYISCQSGLTLSINSSFHFPSFRQCVKPESSSLLFIPPNSRFHGLFIHDLLHGFRLSPG